MLLASRGVNWPSTVTGAESPFVRPAQVPRPAPGSAAAATPACGTRTGAGARAGVAAGRSDDERGGHPVPHAGSGRRASPGQHEDGLALVTGGRLDAGDSPAGA